MNIFDEFNRSRNAALWFMLKHGIGFSSSKKVVPSEGTSAADALSAAIKESGKTDSTTGITKAKLTLGSEFAEAFKSESAAIVIAENQEVEITIPSGVTLTQENSSTETVIARDTPVSDCLFEVKNGGTLILKGNGVIDASQKGATLYAAIKLTVKGATTEEQEKQAKVIIDGDLHIKGWYAAICGNGLRKNTEVIVKRGTLESVAKTNDKPDNATIFNPQADSIVEILGGTLIGGSNVVIKSGALNITGGTFVANGDPAKYEQSNNGFNVTGHCVLVDNCGYPGGVPSATISGGKFTANTDKPVMVVNTASSTAPAKVDITGVEYTLDDRTSNDNESSTEESPTGEGSEVSEEVEE